MIKEEGKDVYLLGDTDTVLTPVEIINDDGLLDYKAIVFSNNEMMYKKGETAIIDSYDLVVGFKTERSVDLLIEKLLALKDKNDK